MTATGTPAPRNGQQDPRAEGGGELLELLGLLRESDVRLTADGDTLGYDAPAAAVTDDLLSGLRKHKGELLQWLTAPTAGPQPETSGPATVYQRRMHQQHTGGQNPAGFNVAQRIPMTGPLDADALGRALTALSRRQSALRCRFIGYGTRLVQEVVPVAPVPVPVTDLRTLLPGEHEQTTREWVRFHAEQPFDLATAPLWRTALLRSADDQWVLLVVVHHIVIDGWGLDVLLRDLGALYAAALRTPGSGLPTDAGAGLPPLTVTSPEVGRWQQQHLAGPRGRELRAHWQHVLAGAELRAALPYDRPCPEQPTGRGGDVTLRIPREPAARLRALAAGHGTTVFTVLLSAFGILLGRLTGRAETLVACNIANRIRSEHEPLVGHFTNNVMLRLGSGGTGPAGGGGKTGGFGALVAETAQTFFAAADHQDYPLPMLRADLTERQLLDDSPFPQVIVVMQTQGIPVLDLPGITSEVHDVAVNRAVAELCLVLTPDADGITCTLNYAADLFEHPTVERWGADYLELLSEVACNRP
ncbi:condensation domain-containing protein [Streptomyces meridianus]|uniref:Condensation domain-containing protein n=1 Tax=Streptomyces meridianus TaxID=2938945 RepID=A0ABT0XAS1_9ACTN|nr:condensation domain-containing protein [Streptomyces meridianus]MCM2579626.1 condensation domain-containing protein [Streptomyces meridianus]